MSLAPSKLRNFAEQLIALEGKRPPAGSKAPAAFLVIDKLRPPLAMLMGSAGFRAMLVRTIILAGAYFPWLVDLDVLEDGSLLGWEALLKKTDEKDVARGGLLMVTRFLGLLVAFIGEDLTLVLVREVWPKASLNDPDLE